MHTLWLCSPSQSVYILYIVSKYNLLVNEQDANNMIKNFLTKKINVIFNILNAYWGKLYVIIKFQR